MSLFTSCLAAQRKFQLHTLTLILLLIKILGFTYMRSQSYNIWKFKEYMKQEKGIFLLCNYTKMDTIGTRLYWFPILLSNCLYSRNCIIFQLILITYFFKITIILCVICLKWILFKSHQCHYLLMRLYKSYCQSFNAMWLFNLFAKKKTSYRFYFNAFYFNVEKNRITKYYV